ILQQDRVPAPLQLYIVIIGHAVIAVDLKTLGQQQPRQMKANEASCSGDEYFLHELMVPSLVRFLAQSRFSLMARIILAVAPAPIVCFADPAIDKEYKPKIWKKRPSIG